MKLTIRVKDIELTPDVARYVDEKIGTLDKYYSRITDGFVELEQYTKRHKNGPYFHAAVDLRLPNKVLRAEKNHVDVLAAIDGIKDELKKQVLTYKEAHATKDKKTARFLKQLKEMTPEVRKPADAGSAR